MAVHLFISVQKAKGLTSFTLNDTPSGSSNAIVGPIPNGFVDAVQDPVPCLSGTRLAFEPINRFLGTIHVLDRDCRDINASMIPFAATGILVPGSHTSNNPDLDNSLFTFHMYAGT